MRKRLPYYTLIMSVLFILIFSQIVASVHWDSSPPLLVAEAECVTDSDCYELNGPGWYCFNFDCLPCSGSCV